MNALRSNLHENKQMRKRLSNPHTGSSFDDFLKADGLYEEVHAKARERAIEESAASAEAHSLNTKRKALPYGLLKGKMQVKPRVDDPMPDDMALPIMTLAQPR
jgi:hypothetical protein